MTNILHLVLYSKKDIYTEMYKITREYYKSFKNIQTYYYAFDDKSDIVLTLDNLDNHLSDIYIENDIIWIPGKENRIPGILLKTIIVLKFSEKLGNYDYVIRSNISTIVDMNILKNDLEIVQMYGGHILVLNWVDKESGTFIDYGNCLSKYTGTPFVRGLCMIFSKNGLEVLFKNLKNLDINIIDDLSIGHLFRRLDIPPYGINTKIVNIDVLITETMLEKTDVSVGLYRNKNENRMIDIINMKTIIKYLINKNK